MNKHLPTARICFPKGCAYMGEGRVSVAPSWDPYPTFTFNPITGLPYEYNDNGYYVGVPPKGGRHDLNYARGRETEYVWFLMDEGGHVRRESVFTENFISGTDTSSPFSPSHLTTIKSDNPIKKILFFLEMLFMLRFQLLRKAHHNQ